MPQMRLTQVAVERLKPPAEGRIEYWDKTLPGFGLRVSAPRAGGEARKTWVAMYRVNGKLVRETLGTIATIPKVDQARDLARSSMVKAGRGIHPVDERRAAERATLNAVLDRYLAGYAARRMRPHYLRETRRAFDYDVRPILGAKAIGEVTRRDVRQLLEAIVDRGSPSVANHVLSYLRAALNWAVAHDYIETNPCNGLRKPAPSPSRDRALNDYEIRVFWRGCDQIGYPFGPLFKLLLLTGQRRSEVAEAKWSEFDVGKALWTLPGERAKNNKPHLVHLSTMAIEIFEALPKHGHDALLFTTTGDTAVSGWSAGLTRLVSAMRDVRREERGKHKDADVQPFTLHDLRRTAATGMAGIGIPPHVVDRILNHTTGKISGVAAIYNRFEYLDERKVALEAWAQHVERLVRPEPHP